MNRADILTAAQKCVCGEREQDYGKPEDNFKMIAKFWSTYKDVDFTAEDVAVMMALLKIARIKTGNGTEDCFVDLAGYAACGGEIASCSEEEARSFDGVLDTIATLSKIFSGINKTNKEETNNG